MGRDPRKRGLCVRTADYLCGTAEALTTLKSNYPQKSIVLRGYYLRKHSYSKKKRKEKEFSAQSAPCKSLQAVWIHLSQFWLRVCHLAWPWSLSPRKENVSGWASICMDTVGGASSSSLSLSCLITHMGIILISLGSWENSISQCICPHFAKPNTKVNYCFHQYYLNLCQTLRDYWIKRANYDGPPQGVW